jgi:hypothetical protein
MAFDATTMAAIKAAIRANEIGSASPYQLIFAGKGSSGASFGVFQNDTAVSPRALACLQNVLALNTDSSINAANILAKLNHHCPTNPLDENTTNVINSLLDSTQGRFLVDALDARTFNGVLANLSTSVNAAATVNHTISNDALLAFALWINMTGAPNTLNRWLSGNTVVENGQMIPAPSDTIISRETADDYLSNTQFFSENPRDKTHLWESVDVGLAVFNESNPSV